MLDPVLRRPVVSATLVVAVLATLAIRTLQIHTASSSIRTMPRSAPTVETLDRAQAAFPRQPQPAVVAVTTDTASPTFKRRSASCKPRPPRRTKATEA